MACAGSLALDIDEMKTTYLYILNQLQASRNALSAAETHWNANDDHEAIYDMIVSINKLNMCVDMFTYRYDPFYPEFMLIHIIEQHLAVPSLDMDAILNTMLGADFDQLQKFIGIVDAYRVAIWNAPFNAYFYGALARGFQKWP